MRLMARVQEWFDFRLQLAAPIREAAEHRLHAATRRSMTLKIARAGAFRLQTLADPNGPYGVEF